MDSTSTIGQLMHLAIATGQLKPIHNGCALKHTGDKYIYCRTTQDRIVRKKGVIKEAFDPVRHRFVRLDNLRRGESVDTSRPFTVEDLAPGVTANLQGQAMSHLYADVLPKPPKPRATPGPAAARTTPHAAAPERLPEDQGMADIDALRAQMEADKRLLWQMETGGPFAPF